MANSFEDLFKLRFEVENAAGVLKSLSATKSAIYDLNKALKDNGVEGRQAFNAFLNATKKQEAALKTLTAQKQKEADNQLKIAERVTNQELALYRKLEIEKAKLMAKYGQIPASVRVSQAMNVPLDSKFKSSAAVDLRQGNITAYRQGLQDIKLFSVEQNKLMQQERQRTAELKRQDAELQKQLKSQQSLSNSLNGMRKAFQGFMTSSFVFKRFFDSTIEVVDEWSKMSIAMSQFRSSGNFDDVNKQLDATVIKLDGVISRYEMIPAINKAKMLGFDFSNGKLSETLEMTTKIAQMFGMDATKAFGDFTVAISKASPIIMDNVGVLLRLEEAYRMHYETVYKGSLSYDEFEKSLTQAEKRAIYYGQAMRLLSEKTEGVSVKTNQAQSVLMRLKDAWYSLGTDLEGGGGLNPIIWALEKVVDLAETVTSTFMKISDGFKALQYAAPKIFGDADIGFKAKNIQEIFVNKKTAKSGIIDTYGKDSLKNAETFYDEMAKYPKKYFDELVQLQKKNAGMLWSDEERQRAISLKTNWRESAELVEDLGKKVAKSKELGYSILDENDYTNMSKHIKVLNEVLSVNKAIELTKKAQSVYSESAYSNYANLDFLEAIKDYSASLGAGMYEKAFNSKKKGLRNISAGEGFVFDIKDLEAESVVKEKLLKIDKDIATNEKVKEFLLRNYNTERDKLTESLKGEYQERKKLSPEQTKQVEDLKKEGALISQWILLKTQQLDTERDNQNLVISSTKLKKEFDPDYLAEEQKSLKKSSDLYKTNAIDLIKYGDSFKDIYATMPEGIKGSLNEIDYVSKRFHDKLLSAVTFGIKDKEELKQSQEEFDVIWKSWLETSKSGAPVALLNNLPALIAGFKQKTSSTGRTKTPKNLNTGWYELNRDLYKEILPEDAIFSKTEDARLELFQKQLDLTKLKNEIAKTQSEGGKVDRNINAKFQEEQKYVEMLTKKYEQVVELANEEYRILMLQQTARQRAMYEFKVEKTTDYLTPGKGSFTVENARLKQQELNDLNQEQFVAENKIAREAAITEEKKKISLGLQKDLTQSQKEYGNTSLFAQKQEEIMLEYKQKEKDLIAQINKDYDKLLFGKLPEMNNNQKEFNDLMSAQSNHWLKINVLYERFGRRQVEITEAFKPVTKRLTEDLKPDVEEAGFGIFGMTQKDEKYMKEKARQQMKRAYFAYSEVAKDFGVTGRMMQEGLDVEGNYDQTGLETYLKTLNMTEAEIKNIQSTFEEMSGGIKSAGQRMVEDMQSVADAWKNIWQDTYRDIANVFGQGLWDSIVNTSGEALWQYKDQRKESLDEEKKNLEQGQITKEQYLNRAAIIEKNFDTQKRNLEKQSTKETLKNLGSMFFFKGLGYLIEAPIKAFEGNPAAAAAYAGAGSALMLLGAGLGYASRGYRPSQTSSFEDEASAKQQDTNIYIDNRLFEDKRQMQKLYQSSLDMEV